ncbi:carboxypeptidase regulatory-like domain-containing protein [uncultured Paludibaculum sp.]|uniref:carboxypeptidase regulatory-like domain-containing protein n=1 Tax=uncultured Paludibaculum sp. TaxID=1765020 RepID=UPI002AAA8B96|nr:carboxypeptidase regulatory-like domain-containing protein [uncultured Paludibaculum sp.]
MHTRLVALFFCLLVVPVVSGQGLGEFVGTITDPSGSALPAAKITAIEIGTKQSRTATTTEQGYFVFQSMRPSVYDITVEAAGFRVYKQQNITLGADQRVTVNVRMELGVASESVTVQSEAAQVDTSTATMKEVVDQRRIVELPLNGRNAAQLTLLVGGAVSSPSGGADQGQTKTFPGAVTVSTNGARGNQISYLLDGGNNVDEYTNVNAPFPFPDALQEFSVQTSNYSAEYGQNAGGVVNIITKSGTNELHGDVFEFNRNAVFNARNYFAAKRDQLKRNQFGGVIGGPMVIPGVYNGRDKTFFFAGYQGTRLRNISGAQSAFVPTPANLAGDFSAELDASNAANPLKKATTILDPLTGQAFPGNLIPVSRFDPASLNVVKMLPAGGGNGSIFFAKPIIQDFNEVVAKVDHAISANDRLSGRYYMAKFANQGIFTPDNFLSYTDRAGIMSQNALIQHTHIFRPNLLNDARLNYARENAGRGPASGVPNFLDLGVKGIYQPPDKAIESISVSGFFSIGDSPPARFTRNNFTLADDLRWTVGRHSLSLGFHGELTRVDLDNQFLRGGTFGFTADITNYAMASFLIGKLRTFRQGNGEFKNNRNQFIGFYVQDDFRVNSRLTVNMGLRYEPFFPWREIRGRVEVFRIQDYQAGNRSKMYPNAPPGLFFPGDAGVPEWGLTSSLKNFAPRVGFAYDLTGDGKTSLRGASGIFFDTRQSGIWNNRFVDVTPFSPQITLTDPAGPFSNPLVGMTNPFPAPFPAPSDTTFPLPVLAITYEPDGHYNTPTIYNYNLALERQFARNWLVRAAYVGSHTSHLAVHIELNPAVYTAGSKLSTDQRRLFQNYQFITLSSQSANSSYNSMQLGLDKRFSQSFTLTANYTWSKSLDNAPQNWNATGPGDGGSYSYPWYFPNANGLDRGLSDFDHAQRLVISSVWQLPHFRSMNALARGVLGDWQLSGVMQAQSGGPLTILAGKDQSQTGLTRDRAVINGAGLGTGACKNTAPCVDYLNPNSFALPDVGTFGNVGKGSFRGPGLLNFDVGFFKNFPIKDRFKVQLRGEFFNLFNRVNLNDPTNSVSSGGFGSIRGAADPRIGQMALKIVF